MVTMGRAVAEGSADRPVKHLYSAEEAAEFLGIGRTFLFRLLATGQIESFKIGRKRKITREALDEYVQRLLREQAASH
jgi:excisionase family DNA binding protein